MRLHQLDDLHVEILLGRALPDANALVLQGLGDLLGVALDAAKLVFAPLSPVVMISCVMTNAPRG